jgi:hypothetical protein
MRAVEQWRELERGLIEGWIEARLSFTPEDPSAAAAAAGVLAPLGPGRFGKELRFHVRPSGQNGVETARNLLSRLDSKRIWGSLSLLDAQAAGRQLVAVPGAQRLVEAWADALRTVPPDWADLLCELELDSTDYLQRAALLGAPLNPTRNPDAIALRFRVSRRGYGASPAMTGRCFERMDEEGITGRVSILNALSETGYVATQGPVWRIAGRAV